MNLVTGVGIDFEVFIIHPPWNSLLQLTILGHLRAKVHVKKASDGALPSSPVTMQRYDQVRCCASVLRRSHCAILHQSCRFFRALVITAREARVEHVNTRGCARLQAALA